MKESQIVARVSTEFPTISGIFTGGVNVAAVVKRVLDLSKEKAVDVKCSNCDLPFGTDQDCTDSKGHRWIRADGEALFQVLDTAPAVNAPTVPLFAVTNTATGKVEAGDIYSSREVADKIAGIYNGYGHAGKY